MCGAQAPSGFVVWTTLPIFIHYQTQLQLPTCCPDANQEPGLATFPGRINYCSFPEALQTLVILVWMASGSQILVVHRVMLIMDMYVGAACHPQPRVTGVANRLRRRPCFRGRIDAVDFCQSVNVVSGWELTPS